MRTGLSLTPWSRAAIPDLAQDAIEWRIPSGHRLDIGGHGRDWSAKLVNRSGCVASTYHEPSWTAAVDRVLVPVSYLRCSACGKRLGDYGECDSCTSDTWAEQREASDAN